MPIALIVAADEPARFYASLRDAERDLEAVDVANGLYPAAYGPRGEPHRITTARGAVKIEALENLAARPEELALLLRAFLISVGKPAPASEHLESLVERCEPYLTGAG